MNNKNPLDYNAYYEKILTIHNDLGAKKALQFLQLFSDLIIKYNPNIDEYLEKGVEK
ncbi:MULTISPECIES: hypothetical protein [Bacillaceae]|uniref:hypothetical protein n=1 Tax=Bacillaceae TaxID=186817 RepID=UPI00203E1FC9|nr:MULTISPECIES: hypothetical protein [Bacillaceae]MCM3164382.1 hypothetical protein [Metabacillus litoralis]